MARDPAFNDLDHKTDDELRALMRKAGMPNQPIISTTRKVIVSRLKKFAATGALGSPQSSTSSSPATSRKQSATSTTSKKATAVFSSDEDDNVIPSSQQPSQSLKSKTTKSKAAVRNTTAGRSQATDSESDVSSSPASRPTSGGRSSPRRNVIGSSATQSSASNTAATPAPSTPAPTLPPSSRSQPAPLPSATTTNGNSTNFVRRRASPSSTSAAANAAFSSDEEDVNMADARAPAATTTRPATASRPGGEVDGTDNRQQPVASSQQHISRPHTPPRLPTATAPLVLPLTPQRPVATTSILGDTVDHAIQSVRQRIGLPTRPSTTDDSRFGGSRTSSDSTARRILTGSSVATPPSLHKLTRTIAQSPPNRTHRDPELSYTTGEREDDRIPHYEVLHDNIPAIQRLVSFVDDYIPMTGLIILLAVLSVVAFGFFAVDFSALLNNNDTATGYPKALSMWSPSSGRGAASVSPPPPEPRKIEPLYAEDLIPICDELPEADHQNGYNALIKTTFCLQPGAEAASATYTARLMVDELRRHRGERECELAPHHEYFVEKHKLADTLRRKMVAAGGNSDENSLLLHDALMLAQLNPHWGVTCVDATGSTPSDFSNCHRIKSHESTHTIACTVYLFLRQIFYYAVGAVGTIILASMLYYFLREYRRMNHVEQKQKMQMVEQILTLVRNHRHNGYTDGIPVNHVRDILVPHRQRTAAALKTFNEAYRYVLSNDSRVVLKESMVAPGGEPQQVLLWSGSAPEAMPSTGNSGRTRDRAGDTIDYGDNSRFNTDDEDVQVVNQLDMSSSSNQSAGNAGSLYEKRENIQRRSAASTGRYWQGNAFAPDRHARADFPSDCLKIRGMFDGTVEDQSPSGLNVWVQEIKDAILDKIGPETRITHMHVDPKSADGIVLAMCASRADAGRAYQALHGNWFDTKLVSVKYLHTQQYLERFPAAAWSKEPMQPSKRNAGKSLRMLHDVQNVQNVAPQ